MKKMKADSLRTGAGLMLALDVNDCSEAEEIVASNRDFIDAVKLGTTLLISPSGGMELISKIRHHYNLPVLVDSKLKDVSHILLATSKSYIAQGATAITCWADVGKEALDFLIDRLQDEIDLVILTALTSLSYGQVENIVKNNVLLAVECGYRLVQIPGNYPELIKWARKQIPSDIIILSCGVGFQGGEIGRAIQFGANYEIIGRHILDSKNMTRTFQESHGIIHEELRKREKRN